jgi:hypothetical protein
MGDLRVAHFFWKSISAIYNNMKSTILALLIGMGLLKMTRAPSNAKSFISYPPQHMKLLSLGYDELVADCLWMRVIQDFDLCKPNAPEGTSQRGGCSKGWTFQMLDQITQLSPKFRLAYVHGATMLTVINEDHDGATILFERGLQQFPNDWSLAYKAAYHYLDEVKNPKRAAELLVVAANNGAPSWLVSLAGKLYTEVGQAELARAVLIDTLERHPDDGWTLRLKQRLAEVEEKLKTASKQ